MARWLVFLSVAVMLFCALEVQAAVMSIDYGTEWFKVGLIKPGMPLDVALNKDSKRKTPSVVTIRNNERIYGSDAVSLAGRFPQLTYFNLKSILAKPYDDVHAQEYRHRFQNEMILDEAREMPSFLHNGTEPLTVEELIAYQFQNARSQAIATAGEDVKDVVITVTPFATQHERQAILDAAELAGLNVLSLMHDETAVALNYALNRQFSSTPEYHIFYDMGAGSTVASIVSFSEVQIKEGKRNKTYPQLEVMAVGFDRTLGGHEFDVRLQKLLADAFMDQNKGKVSTSIYDSQGAMTRLLKEATRVKQILSANTETTASVEGLHEEKDFRLKVTRRQLESLSADLLDRVAGPITNALNLANMTINDIQSVVLVGGNVRMPSVENKLVAITEPHRIAKNVNADEAAVLGAAFHGASLSNQFRLTKEIKIKDITSFPIDVDYNSEPDGDEEHVTLFKAYDTLNTRKTMTFKRTTDFEFTVNYAPSEGVPASVLDKIGRVKVSGLTAAMDKYKEDIKVAEKAPKVRVVFEMSPSGLLSVSEAYLNVELRKSFADKVKSFFGGKEGEEVANNETKSTTTEEPAADAKTAKEADAPDASANAKDAQKNDPVMTKVALQVEFIPQGPQPLSASAKKAAIHRIKTLDALDKMKRLREEARNNLESFVYRTMDFLYDDTVAIVATEEQLEHLREQLSETSDWIYDDGEHADTKAYLDRYQKLLALETPIASRRQEHLLRAETNQVVPQSVERAQLFVQSIREMPDEDRYHTDEELDALTKVIDAAHQWHTTKLEAQFALTPTDEPVLTSKLATAKAKELDDALAALLRKKKPKKKAANKTSEAPTPEPEQKPDTAKDDQAPPAEESQKHQEDHDHDEL